ncbi:hypothetical protein LPY66_02690 [Dehalobacter sp. DCM]|uniref:hypothetical protein n=1 Tax=Dehalobacter sp. DCM TaxID=2907827 RepID=UPI003081790B|nr:hypothetical protein LPY66_02690 [Dehalobacter sp. DCM]
MHIFKKCINPYQYECCYPVICVPVVPYRNMSYQQETVRYQPQVRQQQLYAEQYQTSRFTGGKG